MYCQRIHIRLINRGGKFVFGISLAKSDLSIHIPPQALQEYAIKLGVKVFLMSGSKGSGGFAVAKKELLSNSKIGNVLSDMPALGNYNYGLLEGDFIRHRVNCTVGLISTMKARLNLQKRC